MVACGADDTMGPAVPPDLTGTWSYVALGITGDPLTCDYDLSMQIPQSGPMFTGLYSDAQLVCTLAGMTQLVDFGGGDVVGGALVADSVWFDFDSDRTHNAGTIAGDRMSGRLDIQLIVQVDAQLDTVQVVGDWTATR